MNYATGALIGIAMILIGVAATYAATDKTEVWFGGCLVGVGLAALTISLSFLADTNFLMVPH